MHTASLDVRSVLHHLFWIDWNLPVNVPLLVLSIVCAASNFMLPYVEKVFRKANDLAPTFDKFSKDNLGKPINFYASKLLHISYPPYKPNRWNIAVVALFRTLSTLSMKVQMYTLMLSNAALYTWTFVITSIVSFFAFLFIDTELTLNVAGVCG